MSDPALLVALGALALLAILIVVASLGLARMRAVARDAGALAQAIADLRTRVEVVAAQGVDFERDVKQELAVARGDRAREADVARRELAENLSRLAQFTQQQLTTMSGVQAEQLRQFADRLAQFTQATQQHLSAAATAQAEQAQAMSERIAQVSLATEQRLETLRTAVEQRLDVLRLENATKLDEMRATVDEKLQSTLETRLGESFRLVSERLEQVHRGLGEMQGLAAGVGDLKRVLTNVKTRGTWGEVQLGALLAEMLTGQQYDANVETRPGSGQRVEYAVRLPGRAEDRACWLPIDCKFPLEDWQRLQDALERADAEAADAARKALAGRLREEAKKIRASYVEPPHTTDFAILFVPTESLYAEMMARPGFADSLQRDHRVLLTGPMNLAALLNSLQMGFHTLAIEQRSSEVWKLLGAVKTEFGKFGDVLAKTKERLDKASEEIDRAGVRSRAIARELRKVEALPEPETVRLLGPALGLDDRPAGEVK